MPWKGIVIHHSLTADSGTLSWQAIRRHHTDPAGPYKGRDVLYHAGVELVNGEYEALLGRPLDWSGGHTVGVNKTHLGLLFVGNYDLAPPPDAMLEVACERVIRPWMKAFSIPATQIEPHHAYAHKSCPGTQFRMDRLLAILGTLAPADF